MKKILLLITLLLSSLIADVKYTDLFDAYDNAKAQHKTVMLMLSQKGCPGCAYMEDVVFNNTDVAKKLKEDYIVVHLDVHEDSIPDGIEYFATPTFYFLDADKKVLKRLNGGENAKEFSETLSALKAK